jgi:hypothetical protein
MTTAVTNQIRPVVSSPASLGITTQPATTGTGGNAAVGTSYSPNPANVAGGGASLTQAVAGVANQNASTAAQQQRAVSTVANQFGAPLANDFQTASGGGAISDALQNGVAKIAAFAQNGITRIQQSIQGDMAANNGQIDPAKMQQYTMQMSTFEMIMQMAAKIQEKQERAAQVWLQL